MSFCALCIRSSNVFERWLISITDMPMPGSAIRSRCASSSTGSGSTAGPAEKLNTRVAVGMNAAPLVSLNVNDVQAQNVLVAPLDCFQQIWRRISVEIDARDGGLGALEDDVFRFLNVEVARTQVVEDVRQHPGPIPMPDDEHVCRRRLGREID